MCKHTTLSQSVDGLVSWCKECNVYNIQFRNIVLTFDKGGLQEFKTNMTQCYEKNIHNTAFKNERNLFFDTHARGMKLCFSTVDVGILLALVQEAELAQFQLKYIS